MNLLHLVALYALGVLDNLEAFDALGELGALSKLDVLDLFSAFGTLLNPMHVRRLQKSLLLSGIAYTSNYNMETILFLTLCFRQFFL